MLSVPSKGFTCHWETMWGPNILLNSIKLLSEVPLNTSPVFGKATVSTFWDLSLSERWPVFPGPRAVRPEVLVPPRAWSLFPSAPAC